MSTATKMDTPVAFSTVLRSLTRDAMENSLSADPADIAGQVLSRLTVKQYREALDVCLADWVRSEMGNIGRAGRKVAREKRLTSADRIRSWYAQQLASALFVGSEWKFLRDCSAEDLHLAASERYRKATETHAEGDRWTKVALFMEEHDRETVAQVREDELKSLMEES